MLASAHSVLPRSAEPIQAAAEPICLATGSVFVVRVVSIADAKAGAVQEACHPQ
jgi:hypothetical protein